nr:uncharacterized protein LOC107449770 isoform X2 [Parasteatoda tepidariorum]
MQRYCSSIDSMEFGGTQKCRGTVVENHCIRGSPAFIMNISMENERQSDRPRCDWQQYQQECYFEKLVKARMDVQDIQPSTSCTNQMRDFMSGVNNPTTPRTTTTPSYV